MTQDVEDLKNKEDLAEESGSSQLGDTAKINTVDQQGSNLNEDISPDDSQDGATSSSDGVNQVQQTDAETDQIVSAETPQQELHEDASLQVSSDIQETQQAAVSLSETTQESPSTEAAQGGDSQLNTESQEVTAEESADAEQDAVDREIQQLAEKVIGIGKQEEMPFAVVLGEAITEIPKDLYIPPDALEVFLEAFEGPLDLLLYLIRRQNLDILDINVSEITSQYMSYVDLMDAMHFELAAEYLVMAAMLAEIKSRMLLPRSEEVDDEDEEDPRAQLIRRLQEYERFKVAAEDLDELPRLGRDVFMGSANPPDKNETRPEPDVDLQELLVVFSEVLRRADMFKGHTIEKEKLSTRERMSQVLTSIHKDQFVPFVTLFTIEEGRTGVVVTFLAVMELIKEQLVEIIQSEPFSPIHVKARST